MRSCVSLLALTLALGARTLLKADSKPEGLYSQPIRIGLCDDKRLCEVSGLVPITGLERCYWVHNDSGDKPRILGIRETGEVIADIRVRAAATDWEDIAKGPGPKSSSDARAPTCLFVADTGNNDRTRQELVVWRFREPELPKALASPDAAMQEAAFDTEPATGLRFRYPGKARDCEAMIVHPETGQIYLLTKEILGGTVFRIEGSLAGIQNKLQTAEEVCGIGRTMITAADLSTDGKKLLVRTYLEVQLYLLPVGKPFEEIFTQPKINLPTSLLEVQGESICFDSDESVVTVSEANPRLIHRISPLRPGR